ncbi:hypothetical protein BT63DRAFT_428142 [Microthyrium microscopicum]|uniref:Uncharacterized protein n=1 Tax=Microthyrium microscopicum TaxID=703497 RepID=A0A6A6U510_9PEZI|nr:hypothetical protein BT63DRAFT_428142 [Microthyrium microscopicum]
MGAIDGVDDAIGKKSQGLVDRVISKIKGVTDTLFPPAKREQWLASFKQFAISNPKITAFILTNVVLSGPPLLLFVVFTITVFLVSLVAALVIGLLAAVLFTVFMVLVALLVVLPTVFITTMGATFISLWGLGGYYIVKWFNEGETPAETGAAIGDTLNSITGGRLTWLMETAKGTALNKKEGGSEKEGLLNPQDVALPTEKATDATSSATSTAGTAKAASRGVSPAPAPL